MKCDVKKIRWISWPIIILLSATVAFAAEDGSTSTVTSDDSAVARFQQWLAQRNQASQADLTQQVAEANDTSSQAQIALQQQQNPSQQQATVKSPNTQEDQVSEEAFQQMQRQAMPMTPDQIIQFRKMVQETQRASATLPGTPPKPVSSTLVVNLAPGATPPAVRLYQGFITSVVFVDSSGATWPIEAYDLGNARAFNIQWDGKSNVLMIQPQESYTYANLAVKLQGLSTPVMLTLVPGQSYVDYRVDLRVNGLGPNAKDIGQGSGLPGHADPALLGVLNGVPPSGSKTLSLEGGAGQVWQVGNTMYVRTRFTILSPGWLDVMSSPDGTRAYKMLITPSLLLSQYGKPVEIKVKGT